ncbi:MAG: glycosyltransferase [Deltaproteobacteria bacterium]|nr:glycosyltransferase [Deltaproteobacteria bacterium]
MHIVLFGRFGIGDADEDATAHLVARALRERSGEVSVSLCAFASAPFHDLGADIVDAGDDAGVRAAIARADLVAAIGTPWTAAGDVADLFRASTPETRVTQALLRAVASGVPTALFAVGLAPPSAPGESLAGVLASLATHVSVRDGASAAALRSTGFTGAITVTADPAFAVVPEVALVPPPRRRPLRLGLVPSPSDDAQRLRVVGAAVSSLATRRALEVLVPRSVDAAAIALAVANVVVVNLNEPAATATVLGSCDVVLTTSVHALVLAAVGGTPAVAIGSNPALRSHAQLLGSDLVLDGDACTEETVTRAIERVVDGRAGFAALLASRTAVARTVLDADYEALLAAPHRPCATREHRHDTALEHVSQRLRSRLEQREESWRTLATFLGRDVEMIAPRSDAATQRSRDVDVLRRRAESAEAEVAAIKRSRGWRLLHAYGVLKHHYLFPASRRLGLLGGPSGDEREAAVEPTPVVVPPGTYDVVCFPIIDWDFRFQRPQQLMTRFAAAGHRVFYVEPRFGPPGEAPVVTVKAPNVHHVTLAGPERNVWSEALDGLARDEIFASLNRLRVDWDLGATLAVVELPFWWPLAALARERFAWPILYDCMDDHAGFSTWTGAAVSDEHALFARADLVTVSSPVLAERARRHRDQVLLLRNACDFEHFAATGTRPAHRGRPVIGFYGAIADWFDADLVADLAERRPDWDFVLVGSTYLGDVSRLAMLPNVRLPGEQPYADLPSWLATFDVTLVPFKRTPLTEATNPVKAYEILASGKPIVSVSLPEMRLLGDLVRLADTPEEFERQILASLDPADATRADARRAFAAANTWHARYDELAARIPGLFPKASTVIVTYDNLALNRACLEHLFARTEWPNHEVIVVDNASTDGTRRYLEELATERADLVLIANDRNVGFAAACNQGLARATGAYLVLLNNDTVVTRGWLSTLIRHLHAMPDVGLIGPVTNEIGNEAKVPVDYGSLVDMPAWAARFTREHADRLRGMMMLAMFCLAMRRTAFDEIGALDERFQIGMFEDDDYARRAHQRGYRVVVAMDAFVHHVGGASFKRLEDARYREVFERNRRAFEEKWGPWTPHQDDSAAPAVARLTDRLRRIVDDAGVPSHEVVVFPPTMREVAGHARRVDRIAAVLAAHGMLVLQDGGWGREHEEQVGFHRIAPNLWRYHGPRGTLERLHAPVIWTFAYNALAAFRWLGGTILYDATDDPATFPIDPDTLQRNHDRMLREAELVVCATPRTAHEISSRRPDVVHLAAAPGTARDSDGDGPAEPTDAALGHGLVDLLRMGRTTVRRTAESRIPAHAERFVGYDLRRGVCNVCGHATAFYFTDPALYRESLTCGDCLTTSRYRSIARGLLRAIRDLTGVEASSLAELAQRRSTRRLRVYDTQLPFHYERNAYPIPDYLAACDWIHVHTSTLRASEPLGASLGDGRSNQDLQRLTFADGAFDIVVTSDVLEHVRLHERAHREIRRVLAPDGVYVFTVPHDRARVETVVRVVVHDPEDPARDEFVLEPEYHGDANDEANAALAYRTYGCDLDAALDRLGFRVEYARGDVPEAGILNTELFYCRVVGPADVAAEDLAAHP